MPLDARLNGTARKSLSNTVLYCTVFIYIVHGGVLPHTVRGGVFPHTVLYCTVFIYTVCGGVLPHTVLYCTVLYCIYLYRTQGCFSSHRTVLYCVRGRMITSSDSWICILATGTTVCSTHIQHCTYIQSTQHTKLCLMHR